MAAPRKVRRWAIETQKTRGLIAAACLLGAAAIWWAAPGADAESYGGWSLLPAGLTLLVCFITRNVILALFVGVFSGGLVSGQLNIVQAYLIPSLGTENYAQILLVSPAEDFEAQRVYDALRAVLHAARPSGADRVFQGGTLGPIGLYLSASVATAVVLNLAAILLVRAIRERKNRGGEKR